MDFKSDKSNVADTNLYLIFLISCQIEEKVRSLSINKNKWNGTFTKPSAPMVMSSPSSKKNCSIFPWWHVFLPFLVSSALIKPPSHNSIFPHSDPDNTLPSGNSTKPMVQIEFTTFTIAIAKILQLFFSNN